MTRIHTIERIGLGIDGAIEYIQSGGHSNEAIAGLLDAQKLLSKLDADAFWQGYEEGEAAGRSQMKADYDGACEKSYNLGYAQASGHAADNLEATLYDICSPGEGNLKP
jgi:hypothetical protein